MISIHALSKRFGKLHALHQVSVTFDQGKSYSIMGPNGSGKTTLIKCLLGMVLPDEGTITVFNETILNNWSYREQIGYMPQIGRYPEQIKIGELLQMMQDLRLSINPVDDDLINTFKLNQIANKRMHTLSGGTRQKVSAAIAFLFNPAIYILDEPTAGLDPLAVEIMKEKILTEKQKGKLFLITSHILSDLDELTSEVLYLEEGTVLYTDSILNLKEKTAESKLEKAISKIIKSNHRNK